MNRVSRGLLVGLAVVGLSLFGQRAHAVPPDTADVIFVVDESGSMSGEHAFLQDVIDDLDTALGAAGVTTRNYGVVGFGSSTVAPRDVGAISQGGGFLNATQAAAAFGDLVINGGTEDGWAGIDFALNSGTYAFTPGSARNIILVTDEDRDNTDGTLSYASVLADLISNGALLNDVVNISSSTPANALGVAADGTAYEADGLGGFTSTPGGSINNAFGTTIADYVNMAAATGGASWDLNQLRAGGLTAESFTAAFIAIKVEEITTPEPATLLMFGVGLAGLGFASSRRRKLAA